VRATFEPSTVGGLAVDWANVDADYYGQTAEIRDLEVVGHDIHVDAAGTVALGDAGQSNLQFHAATSDLRAIASSPTSP